MMSKLLDRMSNYLARRKGLLPLLGIILVVLNFMLQIIFPLSWLTTSNLFLHLGLVISIFGFMLARAL